ncbi:MAG TPA: DNA mismatch endonuclease Vsr [Thermoanaerobaculia bacterium]|nr:DNA mismatch endonuclease Vsr [Thermoanaerobaculia bacterium]
MDKLSRAERSENMRRIRSRNMKPELIVRSLAHRLGYRFRLHRKDLPGKPDLVFASRRKVIFVHGCFWHQHGSCVDSRLPKTNADYWHPKLMRNVARDAAAIKALRSAKWRTLVIWECETKDQTRVAKRIERFLDRA